MRALVIVLLFVATLLSPWGAASAQQATPADAPEVACVAPALPPGTPGPMDAPDATTASPVADEPSADAAVPVDSGEPGEPADERTSAQVISAVKNIVGCLASGDYLAFAALLTPTYLQTEMGTDNPYDLPIFLEGFPPVELISAGEVQIHDDGRLSADVTLATGGTQLERFRAYFVDDGGTLLLDEERTLPIKGADVTVEVTMLDYSFELSTTTVPSGAVVAFNLVNEGEYPHEFVVVRLPDGVTVENVLDDPSLMDQVEFFGGAFADPGGTGAMGLQPLEPGTYTAVCFVDVPEGVPHVMRGMVAEFTVE